MSPQQQRRLVREQSALREGAVSHEYSHDMRGAGGFKFPREESLWEKEMLKATMPIKRRSEGIRKEKVATWH